MGKANRERRAAKRRREEHRGSQERSANRARGASGRQRASGGPGGPLGREELRWLLVSGATRAGEREGLGSDLWEALRAVATRCGTGGTGLVVDELFCDCLESVWEGGWQPAEVVRAVRRRRGAEHAELVCTAVAASQTRIGTVPPRGWVEQLASLGAKEPWWGRGRDWLGPWSLRRGRSWTEALKTAVETLGVLVRLPVTEALLPPPSQWTATAVSPERGASGAEEAVLTKVRALLAKAESTTFEHEADALSAKAQELMARYAIDRAVAESMTEGRREAPIARRVPVEDPYANAKSRLLSAIASANQVRAVWDEPYAQMTLVGFEPDLEAVDVLFTSLLMQASKAMLAKGQVRDLRGHSRTRSFRQSFFVAFGQRIHERLVVAARGARQEAERDWGPCLVPVLAGRSEQVEELTARLFPSLVPARASAVTNRDGWQAGRTAAELATLGPVQERLDGTHG